MKVKNVTIIRLWCSTRINTPVNYQQLLWSQPDGSSTQGSPAGAS